MSSWATSFPCSPISKGMSLYLMRSFIFAVLAEPESRLTFSSDEWGDWVTLASSSLTLLSTYFNYKFTGKLKTSLKANERELTCGSINDYIDIIIVQTWYVLNRNFTVNLKFISLQNTTCYCTFFWCLLSDSIQWVSLSLGIRGTKKKANTLPTL